MPYIEECVTFIQDAVKNGGRVYVHCICGVSRSASMVIAYLMNQENLCYGMAESQVKEARSIIRPNNGFQQQLINYDSIIHD